MLDKNSYKFFGENGQLKIIKEALVMAKEELRSRLYKLIKYTMIGDTNSANADMAHTFGAHEQARVKDTS